MSRGRQSDTADWLDSMFREIAFGKTAATGQSTKPSIWVCDLSGDSGSAMRWLWAVRRFWGASELTIRREGSAGEHFVDAPEETLFPGQANSDDTSRVSVSRQVTKQGVLTEGDGGDRQRGRESMMRADRRELSVEMLFAADFPAADAVTIRASATGPPIGMEARIGNALGGTKVPFAANAAHLWVITQGTLSHWVKIMASHQGQRLHASGLHLIVSRDLTVSTQMLLGEWGASGLVDTIEDLVKLRPMVRRHCL